MTETKSLQAARTAARAKILLIVVVALSVAAGAVQGEPRTLYKPQDIANAKANVARYAWAQAIVDGWRQDVRRVVEQGQPFIEQMISDLTPWPTYGQSCPACVGKKSSMGETGLYRWRVDDPDRLVCKYCRTVYPNPKYPETGRMICARMGQTFWYYETDEERAHPEDTSGKHAFRWASWPVHTSWSGLIRTYKADYVVDKALPLAKLYSLTGDVRFAQTAAWILDRLARVYPKLLFHSYNGTYADCPPAEAAAELGRHPRGGQFPAETIVNAFGLHRRGDRASLCNGFWGAGRFGCSGGDGGMLLDMTVAYDLIREARLPDGSPVLSAEMDRRIQIDLILAGCADMEHWAEVNNKCGPGRALSAAVGILFDRPASARRAYDGFRELMEQCFHFDGFCMESPSYSSMHLSLMGEIPEVLRGYSDPPDYRPANGKRFEHFDPFLDTVRYRLALESMVRMAAPGRLYPVLGDTHHGNGVDARWVEILADRYDRRYAGLLQEVQGRTLSEAGREYALWYRPHDLKAESIASLPLHTEWFPGWHVAVLRGGDPPGPTALYLNGYAVHGHRHADTLGLTYFAFGRELVTDRGYIWDDPRNAWTRSTRAHNLVVVDGESQNAANRRSRLELFGAAPGVEVVEASADAYRQCAQYRRTCVLVPWTKGESYAVDFFRVEGGRAHQYCFHAAGTFEPTSVSSFRPIPEKIEWLGNLRSAPLEAPATFTWKQATTRVGLTLLSPADRILLADAPGWRSAAGSEMSAAPIQEILAERRDPSGRTASRFAAVIAPFAADRSPVLSARLIADDARSGALAVEVRLAGRTDIICSALDGRERVLGPVTFAGRFGFVSLGEGGKPRQAYLLCGTRLSCAGVDLRLPAASWTCKVDSVTDRTFHLVDRVPDGAAAAEGRYVLAAESGWEIASLGDKSITVRDYPVSATAEVNLLNSASFTDGGTTTGSNGGTSGNTGSEQ